VNPELPDARPPEASVMARPLGAVSGCHTPAELGPVQAGERIALIDVLRGFALLGIFLVNMDFFRLPASVMFLDPPLYDGKWDRLADAVVVALAQSKFFTLFSFLFGYGMALQMRRAAERGATFVPRYLARCGWLFVFGLLHTVLLWNGDILLSYAILGGCLLVLRRQTDRALIVWAIGATLLALTISIGLGLLMLITSVPGLLPPDAALDMRQMQLQALAEAADTIRFHANGHWLEIAQYRVTEWVTFILPFTALLMWPNVLAMFLLGMVAARRGFLDQTDQFRGVHRVSWAVGILIGIPCNVMLIGMSGGQVNDLNSMIAFLSTPVSAPAMTGLYVVILISLWRWEWVRDRLQILSPVGRMALTNYILQSVIATLLFNGYGLGWMGGVGPLAGTGIVVTIFLLQILFSHAWLRAFRFGPLEWLWRSLTYWKWQPILREPQPSVIV
jgi:uncharacterized protein